MDYEFTEDWFSENNPEKVVRQFDEFLSEFKDKTSTFLEIGSFEGMSTIWMLENILTNKESRLFCIDAWADWTDNAFVRFVSNINKTGLKDKVRIVKGDSSEELRMFPSEYFDFVYVDGDHDEKAVIKDAISSFRVLKKGGIMRIVTPDFENQVMEYLSLLNQMKSDPDNINNSLKPFIRTCIFRVNAG